jgi:alkylation response protein AidB-like acyl-CoA dehydrogenase
MPEQLTQAQRALQQRAEHFAQQELQPWAPPAAASAGAALTAAAKAAGFYGMTQPRDWGGSAASALELTIVREALQRVAPGSTQGVFGPGPGVLAGCGEPLRSSHLLPMLAGDRRGAFGFTEPKGATPTQGVMDGDQIVVTGQKSYVTGGQDADFINTLVHIDGQPALLVIDTTTPGVSRTRAFESLDGSRHAAFRFDAAVVPQAHLITAPGAGLPKALGQIGGVRLAIAAECSGRSQWLIQWLTEHLQVAARNGLPRGASEGVRLRFGTLLADAYAIRSAVYRSARIVDAQPGDDRASINEVTVAKIIATEGLQRMVDRAIGLVGGEALITDHPLAIAYREIRTLRVAEGATDTLYQNLARGWLDLGKGRL